MSPVEQDDDEQLELHGDTLAALQEFYLERDSKEKRFQDLKRDIEQKSPQAKLSMDLFSEDWNASQFWYSDETATTLAKQLLRGSTAATSNICIEQTEFFTSKTCIAAPVFCLEYKMLTPKSAKVSAPSVFVQLKNLIASEKYQASSICLLEYDDRFDVFQEFIHYDFEHPLALPGDMKGKYDCILCDPPFLSPDCQTKAAITVRWLSKPALPDTEIPSTRTIICTGERMEELVLKLYPGIATTTYVPQHAQNRLSNDFRCYSNIENEAWSWRREA